MDFSLLAVRSKKDRQEIEELKAKVDDERRSADLWKADLTSRKQELRLKEDEVKRLKQEYLSSYRDEEWARFKPEKERLEKERLERDRLVLFREVSFFLFFSSFLFFFSVFHLISV